MPAWLSPRVRLGVMASVIVVIVCALLLTPGSSDSDPPPGSVATSVPTPTIEPSGATLPPTYRTPMRALPQAVVDSFALTGRSERLKITESSWRNSSPPSSTGSLPGVEASTQLVGADPATWSGLQATPDGFGEFVLADRGIHLDWHGCADCDTPGPINRVPWGGVGWPGGGGGEAPPNGLTESGNPSPELLDDVDGSPLPGGDSPNDPPDSEGPRPQPPDPVPVPEPSTVTLMCAAFSVMIGTSRARRRQR